MKHASVILSLTAALAISSPAFAQAQSISTPSLTLSTAATSSTPFARFTPKPSKTTRLDYQFWDETLKEMVLYTGPSLRQRASRPAPIVGSRVARGHTSPYRLEGNKVLFEGFDDEFQTMLAQYVNDLVEIGNRVDIASLQRDEQLAYWINLHNALVVLGVAQNYPISTPSMIKGADGLAFHDTKRVTINGLPLSLKNIRQDIVYANWNNPLVIYGFFHGDIGSPSIQRKAYTADNVWETLQFSGKEFANSLRGFVVFSDSPRVSRHYKDAAPYFFDSNFEGQLRRHVSGLLTEDVREEFERATKTIRVASYERSVADMTNGENNRITYGNVQTVNPLGGTELISSTLARAIQENTEKLQKIRRRGLFGVVTIEDIQTVPEEDRLDSGLSIEMGPLPGTTDDTPDEAPE